MFEKPKKKKKKNPKKKKKRKKEKKKHMDGVHARVSLSTGKTVNVKRRQYLSHDMFEMLSA